MGKTWRTSALPFKSGESSGAYALAMKNKKEGIVVGGDYKDPKSNAPNCFITSDGGKTGKPAQSPEGYIFAVLLNTKACIIVVSKWYRILNK